MYDMFAGLPYRHFGLIAMDVPWDFIGNSKAKPGRNARRHYNCMSLGDIRRLPVGDYAAENSLLAFWITGPFLAIGAHVPIMRAYGFEPTAMGLTWIKLNLNASKILFTQRDIFKGGGFTTRKNAEFVVFGKRGRSIRENAGIGEVIISPRREHSRKPDEFYQRMEAYAEVPRLELFARQHRPGWICRGNQVGKFKG